MSQENVELLQSFVEAWNRGDYSAALEPVAPEIEVQSNLGGDFDGTYEGIAGVQKWLAGFWSSFVDSHAEIGHYIVGGRRGCHAGSPLWAREGQRRSGGVA